MSEKGGCLKSVGCLRSLGFSSKNMSEPVPSLSRNSTWLFVDRPETPATDSQPGLAADPEPSSQGEVRHFKSRHRRLCFVYAPSQISQELVVLLFASLRWP